MTNAFGNVPPMPASLQMLLCRAGERLCALPLAHVLETMRALPIDPLPDMPPFVLGVAIIRGAAVPVVAVGRLLGVAGDAAPARFVTLRLGERVLALALDAVVGVRAVPAAVFNEIAPLLRDADTGLVQAVSTLDAELLLVLQATRLLPESTWEAIERRERAA